jgi:hypothetical protein
VVGGIPSFRTSPPGAGGRWKTLVVTSSLPGEEDLDRREPRGRPGQLGRRCSSSTPTFKPRIHEVLGVSNKVGLASVLAEGLELEKAIQQTKLPNVSVLTAGPLSPNPSGLLASEAMENLFKIQKGV